MSNFKNNLKILIIVTILIKILGFTYKILQARFFPFSVLETISAINPIISFSLVMSQMSIPMILTSLISKNISNRTYYNRPLISKAIKINLFSTTIIIFLMLIISIILNKTVYQKINIITPLLILFPSLYFSNMSAIIKSYLEAHENFKRTITSNLIEAIIKITGITIIVIFLKSLNSNIILIISSSFVTIGEISSFFFLIFKVKKITKLKLVNDSIQTKLLKPGFSLTLFALIFSGYHLLEPMLYYFFTGHIKIDYQDTSFIYTSIHSYCLPLFQISGFMTYIVIKLMTPRLSKAKSMEESSLILNKIFYILVFFEGLILIMLFFGSNIILKITYNKENITYMMKILSVQTYLTFFSPIITMSLEAHLKYKILLKNAILSCILGLLSIIIFSLIPSIAIYAIFISGFISDLIYYVLNIFDYKEETKQPIFNNKNTLLFFLPIIILLIQALINTKISFIILLIIYFLLHIIIYLKRKREPSFVSDIEK